MKTILITGGAGFIGSCLVRQFLQETPHTVVNLDKLAYSGHRETIADILDHDRHRFEQVDICDEAGVGRIFSEYQPDAVIHLAAESHVDRSIDSPREFISTNIAGTFTLLEASRAYLLSHAQQREHFRFIHVSTDEVYGSLGETGYFTEETCYQPSSPYSASKAASDHLAMAWHATYKLPVIITNCSNNYGPYQLPEKLMPMLILRSKAGQSLPIYGTGENIRDWLYVEDHARALRLVLERGRCGETYNIGGGNEKTNIEIAKNICSLMDELCPDPAGRAHSELLEFVTDRPGHDLRYAIDAGKISSQLGWEPLESFETGLRKTVTWYLENTSWCDAVVSGSALLERKGTRG